MQSAPSTGSSPAIPSANLPQPTSSTSSPHPQSHPAVATPIAVTHPASQSQQPQSAAPSTGRTRHESIFHFRSERAQWLTLVGIILALAALITACVYAANAQKLAEWEAEKDYQLYCLGLKVQISLPSPGYSLVDHTVIVVFACCSTRLRCYIESPPASTTWP
jgi:hypothetical protein